MMNLDPYQFELASLEAFNDPSLTLYEVEKLKIISTKSDLEMPLAASKLLDIVEAFRDVPHHHK